MITMEDLDRFADHLYEVLRGDDNAGIADLEYVGFGILRVKLNTGAAMLVIASPVDDDDAGNP